MKNINNHYLCVVGLWVNPVLKKIFLRESNYLNNANGKSLEAKASQAVRPVRVEGRMVAKSQGHLGPGVTPAQTCFICGAQAGDVSSLNLGVLI